MKIKVIKSHIPESEDPIFLSLGDRVQIQYSGNRSWHWMGNIFCTLTDGRSGWTSHNTFKDAHEIETNEINEGVVDQEFNGIELRAEVGEVLEGYATFSQAMWCRNARGESGWLPFECFEEDEADLERRQVELIAEINRAFAEVEKADGIGLREASTVDATRPIEEMDKARAEDVERWQDLSDELLRSYIGSLMWSDAIGFRYLLPAYMCFSLREIENRYCAEETVVRIFRPFIAGISFTQEQSRAIGHFCELMLDMGIISASFEERWHRDGTHKLLLAGNEALSPEWFKAPLRS
jgi:hypothetical protein